MASRLGAGIPLASLPLIAAVPAFEAANLVLAWAFIALFVVTLVGVFADRIAVLHNLPVVGAPKLSAEFELNGSSEMRMGLRRDAESASALLLVRIRLSRHGTLQSPLLNLLLPRGIRLDQVDPYGETREDGEWLQPTQHRLGNHEWADRWRTRPDLTSEDAKEFWFKLEFRSSGRYPLLLMINDAALHREFQVRAEIEVYDADELVIRDQFGVLIDRCEALLGTEPDAFTGPNVGTADLLAGLIEAHRIAPDEVVDLLGEIPSDPKGISIEVSLRAQLRGLYDAQRALP